MDKATRRTFLKNSVATGSTVGLAASAAKAGGLIGAARAMSTSILGANERVGLGLIGCGGRGREDMKNFLKQDPTLEMSAVCDVDDAMLAEAQKLYQQYEIPVATPADRVRHVIQSAFGGRRIVIFSGGATAADEAFFTEIRAIRDGGGFGSIIGRNSFQRKKEDALTFLGTAMGIYEGSVR